jgi:hypothetical protein
MPRRRKPESAGNHKKRHIGHDDPPAVSTAFAARRRWIGHASWGHLAIATKSERMPRLQPMEQTMKKILAAIAVCGFFVAPALAVSANVESAVKAFDAVAADAGKLKTYCEINNVMSTASDDDDDAKSEALDKQVQALMKELGPEFEAAFETGADLDPESEDGKAYDAAIDKLDGKCP